MLDGRVVETFELHVAPVAVPSVAGEERLDDPSSSFTGLRFRFPGRVLPRMALAHATLTRRDAVLSPLAVAALVPALHRPIMTGQDCPSV